MALYRARYLADPALHHAGRSLLLTFNNSLIRYIRSLSSEGLPSLDIRTYHHFARGYLNSRGLMSSNCICDKKDGYINQALENLKDGPASLLAQRKEPKFFVNEIRWMQQHDIYRLEDYLAAKRVGRGKALQASEREAVWRVFSEYLSVRQVYGKIYDWDDLSGFVHQESLRDVEPRMYKHIIVDEGQDFSPSMLRSLSAILPIDGSLTYFGDMAQQIYGNRISWRAAGLNVDGNKVYHFQDNYRNTRAIARIALAIAELPYFKDYPDLVEPTEPAAEGPPPALAIHDNLWSEIRWVEHQALRFSQTQTVAILFRNRSQERRLSEEVRKQGTRLHKNMNVWRETPTLYYGTFHSAKGLEFDTVIVPFCSSDEMPFQDDKAELGEEALSYAARLLYVGVTRARKQLLLTFSQEGSEILPNEDSLFQVTRL